MSQINSKNTKYELANALIELTKEHEFKDISISSVAFKANMHRNTVYYHFTDMRDLCFFTIHNELVKSLDSHDSTTDALIFFFSRFKPLLDFTRREVGVDSFLSRMRIELLPAVEPLIAGEYINSDEKKRAGVDMFVEQLLVAYLLQDRPGNMIRIIFENIMPEFLAHDFLRS